MKKNADGMSFLERYRQRASQMHSERAENPDLYVERRLSAFKAMGPLLENRRASESQVSADKSQHQTLMQYNVVNRNSDVTNMRLANLGSIFHNDSVAIRKALEKIGKNLEQPLGSQGSLLDLLPDHGFRRRGRGVLRDGVRRAKGLGGRILGSTRDFGARVLTTVEESGGVTGAAKGIGSRAGGLLKSGGEILGKVPGASVLGKVAAPIAGYEAITNGMSNLDTVTDSNASDADRMKAGAHLAVSGAGTVIGGALGGVKGAALGAAAGDMAVDAADYVGDQVKNTKIGEMLGRGMAVAMTPFSEDARKAVLTDWHENIVPGLASAVAPMSDAAKSVEQSVENLPQTISGFLSGLKNNLSDFMDRFSGATDTLSTGVSKAAGSAWAAAKRAASQVAEGASAGGVHNFVHGIVQAGRTLRSGAGSAISEVSDAVRLAGAKLGAVSEKYESGGRGVGTISSGKGDAGGVSYGKHQLATNNGSMHAFLASKEAAPIAAQFQGLVPGSKAFNDKYQQLTSDPTMAKQMDDAQHNYIQRTHFEPLAAKLKKDVGMDVSKEDKSVQEAVWSTAVQYGGDSSVASKAWAGKDLSKMTAAEKISALQDYKAAHAQELFRSSSPEVQASQVNRALNEKRTLLAVGEATKHQIPNGTEQTDALSSESSVGAVVSQHAVKPKNEQIASLASASVSQNPVQMVPKSMPEEVSSVSVTNQPEPVAPVVQQVAAQKSESTVGRPQLDDVPISINDMGLILIQTGHV